MTAMTIPTIDWRKWLVLAGYIALLALMLTALHGCDDEPAEATTIEGDTLTVKWVIVPSAAKMQELRAQFPSEGAFHRVNGFATGAGTPWCVIYTMQPRAIDDFDTMRTIMHEIKHCVEGAWHD